MTEPLSPEVVRVLDLAEDIARSVASANESSEDGVWGIDYEERLFEARLEGVIPMWGDEDKPCTYKYVLKFETNITRLSVSYSRFLQTSH